MKNNFKNKIEFKSGFTFIELVVVIAIFGIMASILMFNFRDFTANIDVKNLASDIALSIKKAQTLALSGDVKFGYNNSTDPLLSEFSNRISPTYGIFFANGVDVQGISDHQREFVIFKDKNNFNFLYNSITGCNPDQSNTECLDKILITDQWKHVIISEFCVDVGTPDEKCSNDKKIKGLAITFKRPYPDAIITLQGQNATKISTNHQNAQIVVSSVVDPTKNGTITITNLGQITVK